MNLRFACVVAGCAWLAPGAAVSAPPGETVESWPDGTVKARFEVDDLGRKHGRSVAHYPDGTVQERAVYRTGVLHGLYNSYHPGGKPHITATYDEGVLHKKYVEKDEQGDLVRTSTYDRGVLDGEQAVYRSGKPVAQQVWAKGRLERLNGVTPYPRPLAELRTTLRTILGTDAALADDAQARARGWWSDEGNVNALAARPKAERLAEALRRLQAYRWIVEVPWEGMDLREDWNDFCEAGAQLCARIGKLDHTPPNPGMDEAEYKKGYTGTSNSNLSAGAPVEFSVDGYMDDSDPSNIDRLGHRCWCMNPRMLKTGFGFAGGFSAMWSMDRSRPKAEFEQICFPARGYMPVGFFGAEYAWSVSLNESTWKKPNPGAVKARVYPLDEHLAPAPLPLTNDTHRFNVGGYGVSWVVIFRPVGIEVAPGRRYWVGISGLAWASSTTRLRRS